MLYLLLGIVLIFLIINYKLADHDYMHPGFIFSLIFLMSTVFCILETERFAIVFHLQTVLVVGFALFAFTLISVWMSKKKSAMEKRNMPPIKIESIPVSNTVVCVFILIEVVTLLYFVKYLQAVSIAHHGTVVSLSEMISLYDTMTKFWTEYFNELAIPVPLIYRLGNPLTQAGGYLLLYVLVNNFIADKKINILHVISVGLLCAFHLLNGSRSPLLRMLTMAVILFYVLKAKESPKIRGNIKIAFSLVILAVFAAVGFIIMLNLMGRDDSMDVERYLFIYLGAPLVNFDNFLAQFEAPTLIPVLGAQTFRAIYLYAAKLLKIPDFWYDGLDEFAFSNNGIEIGNVYTTFYEFVYDFGYIGVIPLIAIIALYYVWTYNSFDKDNQGKTKMDYKLFIYSYLFNDLVMLFFSNRFFQTSLDAPFIKLFIVSWGFKCLFIEKKIHLGKHRTIDLSLKKEYLK